VCTLGRCFLFLSVSFSSYFHLPLLHFFYYFFPLLPISVLFAIFHCICFPVSIINLFLYISCIFLLPLVNLFFIHLFFLSYSVPSPLFFRHLFLPFYVFFLSQFTLLFLYYYYYYYCYYYYILIHITSPLRMQFPLINPIDLRRYLVTCAIPLPGTTFQFSSISSLILAFI
jgi:hypothetical protein